MWVTVEGLRTWTAEYKAAIIPELSHLRAYKVMAKVFCGESKN